MADVYLGIYECPRHHYTAIMVEPLNDSGGTRLTPSKCCGSWTLKKRWKVDAEETVNAIQCEADTPAPKPSR